MEEIEGRDIFAEDFIRQEQIIEESWNPSEIQKFFDGTTIFITGGTGFLGKILIEKLLRVCWRLKKIYLLIRPKKGKTVEERFGEIFEEPVFDLLKKNQPNFKSKVFLVIGDMADEKGMLSEEDRQMLIGNVDIIFHCAATVRFDEKIRRAININVKATKFLLDMAHDMKNLKAFLHVSTAYSNCTRREIKEQFYPPQYDYKKLSTLLDVLDDNVLDKITPEMRLPRLSEELSNFFVGLLRRLRLVQLKSFNRQALKMPIGEEIGEMTTAQHTVLLDQYPNTYAFTKMVAEDVVREYGKGLPIGIIRPSIVISTWKEPITGWINNYYGPQGVVFGAALGLLRTLHCDPDVVADMVPVDCVINAIIAMTWDVGQTKGDNPNFEKVSWKETLDSNLNVEKTENSEEISILNYVSSVRNPINWGTFMTYNYRTGPKNYSTAQIWHSSLTLNANYYVDRVYRVFCHLLPAILVDLIAIILQKKPMLWNSYKKIHKFTEVISYFCTSEWYFSEENVIKLWDKLSPKDQKLFYFNIQDLSWEEYFQHYLSGLRVYLLKDDSGTQTQGRRQAIKLKIYHYTLVTIVYSLLFYFLYRIFCYLFM